MTAANKIKIIVLKHGNWYLLEGDKNLVRESTKGAEFSWFWERECANFWQVLDSFLCPAPVEKTLQFGPSLDQNCKALYLMILCKVFLNLSILV